MNNQFFKQIKKSVKIFPIGYIRRNNGKIYLDILKSFIPALKQLEHFSHVQVFWWFNKTQDDECRKITQNTPHYENAPVTGVFASRSPVRPNPIALTTTKILKVDHDKGIVHIANVDAYDNTPIVDLKAYIPIVDRVKNVKVPKWISHWPEWMPDEGMGLEEGEDTVSNQLTKQKMKDFTIFPIGYTRKNDGKINIEIFKPYLPALKQLEHFSHIQVLWWFHRLQDDRFRRVTQNKPPYEKAPLTGVFASRSPVRPNPIALTTTRILHVEHDNGIIEIGGIDAYKNTPIIDLKPYIPVAGRVKRVRVPEWISHWSEWMQETDGLEVTQPDNLLAADSDRLAALRSVRDAPSEKTLKNNSATRVSDISPVSIDSMPVNLKNIIIRGARQHNLKNIDVTIPRSRFTVITGVSGSGKSSLAFDTLHAEGQRRYMDSLSVQARGFLDQMEKPAVDYIVGLTPTVAIEQKTVSRNPRSTIGTVTLIYDYLRVLFARLGTRHCPRCGRAVKPQTAQQITDQLAALTPGTSFKLLAPLVRGEESAHTELLEQLRNNGCTLVRIDGEERSFESRTSKTQEHRSSYYRIDC